MQARKRYTLTKGKLNRAYKKGFDILEDGTLVTNEEEQHLLVLKKFSSFEEGSRWGRFSFEADISPKSLMIVHAFARDGVTADMQYRNKALWDHEVRDFDEEIENFEQELLNEEEPVSVKKMIFEAFEAKTFRNITDILLYDLIGEYLFIAIEVIGDGVVKIQNMRLDTQGDNFMQTFPEIFRDEGGFFHRYMSVFSSIYNDLQLQIDQIDKYLDFDTVPIEFLPILADWLGFRVDQGFLEENTLRTLLKEIYSLNRMKGTKAAIKRIVNLLAGCDPVIIERSRLEGYISTEDTKVYKHLYGEDVHDITILLNLPEDEKLYAKLKYLLDLFKPVRSTLRLSFIENSDRLDSYCYLDLNASLVSYENAKLDQGNSLNERYFLK